MTIRRRALITMVLLVAAVAIGPRMSLRATAASVAISEYSTGSEMAGQAITSGPDGAVWFAASVPGGYESIGRMCVIVGTPADCSAVGQTAYYPVPTNGAGVMSITAGPDGNLWFTEYVAGKIGRVTLAGQVTEFPLSWNHLGPGAITAGADGNLWFTTDHQVMGRITTAGAITEYPMRGCNGAGVTTGPGGNLWYGESCARVGEMSTAGVDGSQYPLRDQQPNYGGQDIATGSDGNLWYLEDGGDPTADIVARVTPGGGITKFTVSTTGPLHIAAGPDGALWFTDGGSNSVAQLTTHGSVTKYPLPASQTIPGAITEGPFTDADSMWVAIYGHDLARVGVPTPPGFAATEGSARSGAVGTFADADGNTVATAYTATIQWGDGSSSAGAVAGSNPFTVSGFHTYKEEGSYSVSTAVKDSDGASYSVATTATVADAHLSATGSTVQLSGSSYSGVLASFADADPARKARDYAATIDWGDGKVTKGSVASTTGGAFTVSGSHTYVHNFSYPISVVVQDAGGSVGGAAATVVGPLTEDQLALVPPTTSGTFQGVGAEQTGAGSMAAGPDGNIWFTSGSNIGRLTPSGTETLFDASSVGYEAYAIAAGPDGNLWFTEFNGTVVGRITPSGDVTSFQLHEPGTCAPWGNLQRGITAGPDGDVWLLTSCPLSVMRVTPSGFVTDFPVPTTTGQGELQAITAGPDGNLWFTDNENNIVWRMTTSGVFTPFQLPSASYPMGITAGPDGNIWFEEAPGGWTLAGAAVKMTPAGAMTIYNAPCIGYQLTAGPDGKLWFSMRGDCTDAGQVASMTTSGVVTEYPLLTPQGEYSGAGVTAGPVSESTSVWFSERWCQVGRIDTTRT